MSLETPEVGATTTPVLHGLASSEKQPAAGDPGLVNQSTLGAPVVDDGPVREPSNPEQVLAAIQSATSIHEAVGALRGLTEAVDISLGNTRGGGRATNHWILVRPGKDGTELIYRRDRYKWVNEHIENPFMTGWRNAGQSNRTIVERSWGFPGFSVSQGSIRLAEPTRLARLFANAMKLDFAQHPVAFGTRDRLESAGYQCNRM